VRLIYECMFISKRCGCKSKEVAKPPDRKQLDTICGELTVLSVKSRMELLFLLRENPHCVCDLIGHTGMSQSLISHHLSDLTDKGYVESKRNGKYVDYALTGKGDQAIKALELLIK